MFLKEKLLLFANYDKPDLSEVQEDFRRLRLSKQIFVSLFTSLKRREALEHYSNLFKIANARDDLLFTELLAELVDVGSIPEDPFFEENMDKVLMLSYYLVYGNPQLEMDLTTKSQREEAKNYAADCIKRHMARELLPI
jgi:hypothetical protein